MLNFIGLDLHQVLSFSTELDDVFVTPVNDIILFFYEPFTVTLTETDRYIARTKRDAACMQRVFGGCCWACLPRGDLLPTGDIFLPARRRGFTPLSWNTISVF